MGFGAASSEQQPGRKQAPDSPALLAEVRSVGEELMDDLQRAEGLSGQWSDGALADALVGAALDRCLKRLAGTGLWGEGNRTPSSELWRIAGRWLEVGWLQQRARFKPRGYAGDYELLTRICEETCCDDPLGRAFDRYFLSQAAPQAVRSRTEQTAAALVEHCLRPSRGAYHLVSVGSGPAMDVRQALAMLPSERRRDVQVTLIDMDPEALDFARNGLEPLVPREPRAAIRCERMNVFRLAQACEGGAVLGDADFLICAGLFDYLDHEQAVAMLHLFWQGLGQGGQMVVGNFAPHNPTRAYMEWIGNWYLIYRTAGDLQRLAEQAGIPADHYAVGCERLGVDLFLVGSKRS